jgi:hypothetical protein
MGPSNGVVVKIAHSMAAESWWSAPSTSLALSCFSQFHG